MIDPSKINKKLIKQLRDSPLKTADELNNWLITFLGVHLASVPIDAGNSAPLQFAWDIYKTALDSNITADHVTNFLGLANRGGQKTLTCSSVITMLLLHDKYRDIIHMASIAAQANVLFEVWLNKFVAMPNMEDVFSKFTMRRTIANSGRMLTVTHGTMDAVNAHHGGILIQDELDLTDPVVFDESKGMLVASRGMVPINVMISSRKYAMGNIQNILDKVDEDQEYSKRIHVHRWGQLETTRKCEESRSGKHGTEIMVNDDQLLAISMANWKNLNDIDKGKFRMVVGYENCLKCGIFSFCKGNLKKQNSNPHLTPIDVTADYFRRESKEFFSSQRLNRRPPTKGLVYAFYDPLKHDKTDNEIAELITDEKYGDINSLEGLMDLLDRLGLPVYMGVDFGYNEVAASLITVDKKHRMYVIDELIANETSDAELALITFNKWGKYKVNYIFPDVASPGGIKEMRKVWSDKCGICTNTVKDVEYGINLVRNRLIRPGNGEPALFIHKYRCRGTRYSFKNYRYRIDTKDNEPTEKVLKKYDHICFIPGHEILTRDGWKDMEIVEDNEDIMVVSNTGKYFYEKPVGWVRRWYEGETVECKHNFGTLFECTSDHPIVDNGQYNTKRMHKVNLKKVLYKDIQSVTYIPCAPTGSFNQKESDQLVSNLIPKWAQHDPEAFFWFVGFWLGDGTLAANRKAIKIMQSKKKNFEEITEKFKRLFKDNNIYEWDSPNHGYLPLRSWQVHHKEAYEYFKILGKMNNKHVPIDLLNAPRKYLWEMLDGLIKSDGSIYHSHRVFNSTSKKLIDQVQEICVKLGVYSNLHLYKQYPSSLTNKVGLPCYRLTVSNKSRTYNITKDKFKTKSYRGMIYCPKTSTGFFVIRRNGLVSLASNCDSIRYVIATISGTVPFTVSFGTAEMPNIQPIVTNDGLPTIIHAPTGDEMLRYANKTPGPTPIEENKEEPKKPNSFWFSVS